MFVVHWSTCSKCSNTIEVFRFGCVLKEILFDARESNTSVELLPGLVYHTWLGIHLWLWPRTLSLEWRREERSVRCSNARSHTHAIRRLSWRETLSELWACVCGSLLISLSLWNFQSHLPETFMGNFNSSALDATSCSCKTTYFYYLGISTSFSLPSRLNNIWRPWEVCERKRREEKVVTRDPFAKRNVHAHEYYLSFSSVVRTPSFWLSWQRVGEKSDKQIRNSFGKVVVLAFFLHHSICRHRWSFESLEKHSDIVVYVHRRRRVQEQQRWAGNSLYMGPVACFSPGIWVD